MIGRLITLRRMILEAEQATIMQRPTSPASSRRLSRRRLLRL